jgi:hypothetical protein
MPLRGGPEDTLLARMALGAEKMIEEDDIRSSGRAVRVDVRSGPGRATNRDPRDVC